MLFFIGSSLPAKTTGIEEILKEDFSRQQTIKIKFEVNNRLYSAAAGTFRLDKIAKNRKRLNEVTRKIVPWSIMEALTPKEVARIIVYIVHAEEAGASFLDSEDLIPLVAKRDISLTDFVLMVQYIKETKQAGIPTVIRESFIGKAFNRNFDGISILAGGRGLIIAKKYKFNLNKAASFLLDSLPRNGFEKSPRFLAAKTTSFLETRVDQKISARLINNFAQIHEIAKTAASPSDLKRINKIALKITPIAKRVKKVTIPPTPKKNKKIDIKRNILPVVKPSKPIQKPSGEPWTTLSQSTLNSVIKNWLGTRYRFGGKTRRGIDCSGFTYRVLIDPRIGVPGKEIGHGTIKQKYIGKRISRKKMRTGDLIFFSASPNRRKITHVGIVASRTSFAHASSSRGVKYDKLNKKYYRTRYVMSRRVFKRVVN
jgi:hypothetical protein